MCCWMRQLSQIQFEDEQQEAPHAARYANKQRHFVVQKIRIAYRTGESNYYATQIPVIAISINRVLFAIYNDMKHTFNACPKSNVQIFSQLDKRNIYCGLNAHPDCVNQEAVGQVVVVTSSDDSQRQQFLLSCACNEYGYTCFTYMLKITNITLTYRSFIFSVFEFVTSLCYAQSELSLPFAHYMSIFVSIAVQFYFFSRPGLSFTVSE